MKIVDNYEEAKMNNNQFSSSLLSFVKTKKTFNLINLEHCCKGSFRSDIRNETLWFK